jgi:uncharacterized coiled-coil protein SlyX
MIDCAEYQARQGVGCKNCPTCHQEAHRLVEELRHTIADQKLIITDHEEEIERLQDGLSDLQNTLDRLA